MQLSIKLLLFSLLFSTSLMASSLNGEWNSECSPIGRHAYNFNLKFHGAQFFASGSLFEKPGCKVNTVTISFTALTQVSPLGENLYYFDYIPSKTKMVLKTQGVVDHYNQNNICGFNDWELNKAKDVSSNHKCVGIHPPAKNIRVFDLMKFQGGQLQFANLTKLVFEQDLALRPDYVDEASLILSR